MGMALAHEIILPSTGASADMSTGSIFFIGTATALIRYAGFTVLTDPNFIHMHEKVDLGHGCLPPARRIRLEIMSCRPWISSFSRTSMGIISIKWRSGRSKSLPIVTTPEAARHRASAALALMR
jgi:hypothetical protein